MTNREEMTRWLLDAEDTLKTTKANYKEGLIRATVQNAQLCIEVRVATKSFTNRAY